MTEHDAKGLEIIAGWLQRDGLTEPAAMLRRLAAGASERQADHPIGYITQLVADRLHTYHGAIWPSMNEAAIIPVYTHPSAELTALRERIAGMEKDAERWKWLKLQATVGEQHEIMRTPWGKWDEYADAAIVKLIALREAPDTSTKGP